MCIRDRNRIGRQRLRRGRFEVHDRFGGNWFGYDRFGGNWFGYDRFGGNWFGYDRLGRNWFGYDRLGRNWFRNDRFSDDRVGCGGLGCSRARRGCFSCVSSRDFALKDGA